MKARTIAILGICLVMTACAQPEYSIGGQVDLQNYLDHFNAHRYEEQIRYYADDVAYSVGTLDITSPQQIAEFYDDFHDYVDEHVEIAAFAMEGDTVAVVMPTRFEARETYDKHGLLFEAGTVTEIVSFIFYELRDGKIWRIRVARYNGTAEEFANR